MADTYLSGPRGADKYQQNGRESDTQQSKLYDALMQQTMRQEQAPGVGGIISKMLSTYMGMGGNPMMSLFGGKTVTGAPGTVGDGVQPALLDMPAYKPPLE